MALVWGIFSIIKGAVKTKYACKFSILLDCFWRIYFHAYKNLYPPKKWETWEKFENKKFGLGKNNFGSDTNTEIESWFRFPILKPGFGRTLKNVSSCTWTTRERLFYPAKYQKLYYVRPPNLYGWWNHQGNKTIWISLFLM